MNYLRIDETLGFVTDRPYLLEWVWPSYLPIRVGASDLIVVYVLCVKGERACWWGRLAGEQALEHEMALV
jgi:hypothetical protein